MRIYIRLEHVLEVHCQSDCTNNEHTVNLHSSSWPVSLSISLSCDTCSFSREMSANSCSFSLALFCALSFTSDKRQARQDEKETEGGTDNAKHDCHKKKVRHYSRGNPTQIFSFYHTLLLTSNQIRREGRHIATPTCTAGDGKNRK